MDKRILQVGDLLTTRDLLNNFQLKVIRVDNNYAYARYHGVSLFKIFTFGRFFTDGNQEYGIPSSDLNIKFYLTTAADIERQHRQDYLQGIEEELKRSPDTIPLSTLKQIHLKLKSAR